jgi:hypothetical protein
MPPPVLHVVGFSDSFLLHNNISHNSMRDMARKNGIAFKKIEKGTLKAASVECFQQEIPDVCF